MGVDIIKDRLQEYSIRSKQEELNALKEIYPLTQENPVL